MKPKYVANEMKWLRALLQAKKDGKPGDEVYALSCYRKYGGLVHEELVPKVEVEVPVEPEPVPATAEEALEEEPKRRGRPKAQ